jgi:hypothetical protein
MKSMHMPLEEFEQLKHTPMRQYLSHKVKIPRTSRTKASFVNLYRSYLRQQEPASTTGFRVKMEAFNQCKDRDLVCMLGAMGLDRKHYENLLKVKCTAICKLRSDHVPLALVSDPTARGSAIGIQTTGGVVPISRSRIPPNVPVVIAPRGLLDEIRNAEPLSKTKTRDAINNLPDKSIVDIRRLDENSMLFAIQEATQSLRKDVAPEDSDSDEWSDEDPSD